jgi:RNA polymerase sigma-70 factor (ECF subfamily)
MGPFLLYTLYRNSKIRDKKVGSQLSDIELIQQYLQSRDEQAFKFLLDRYHKPLLYRLIRKCGSRADAEDLVQQVWMRVLDNIENYQDQGKFSAYLSTIATNLLNDYWRRKGVRSDTVSSEALLIGDNEDASAVEFVDRGPSPEDDVANKDEIDCLVTQLIPALPCDQRLVYLLRHESEHWEGAQRLTWSDLAELNGMDSEEIWSLFESARAKLTKGEQAINNIVAKSATEKDIVGNAYQLDCMERLIFLVWTQAQRLSKREKYTEFYFAELLGIPVNTFKTRYRSAIKALADGLAAREAV